MGEATEGVPPVLEHLDGLFTTRGGEILEEFVEREPRLEVLDQGIDGNPRATEDEGTADDGRIGSDMARFTRLASCSG